MKPYSRDSLDGVSFGGKAGGDDAQRERKNR